MSENRELQIDLDWKFVCKKKKKRMLYTIIVAHYHSTYEPMETIGVFKQNRKNIEMQMRIKCNEL